MGFVDDQPAHRTDGDEHRTEERLARVPAVTVETQNKGEQVERQRHQPQHRDAGDVFGHVIGHREQQRRCGRRQHEPPEIRAARGGWRVGHGGISVWRRRRALARAQMRCSTRLASRDLDRKPSDHHDEHRIQRRPAPSLVAKREHRLDDERIAEQRGERRAVRQCEETIRIPVRMRSREPHLHQRARRSQHEVRKSDRRRQEPQDVRDRRGTVDRLPVSRCHDRQRQQRYQREDSMDARMADDAEPPRRPVCIRISGKQRALEKHHARGPDRSGPAEPRKDLLGDQRLHQEDQECRERNDDCEVHKMGSGSSSVE